MGRDPKEELQRFVKWTSMLLAFVSVGYNSVVQEQGIIQVANALPSI